MPSLPTFEEFEENWQVTMYFRLPNENEAYVISLSAFIQLSG